MLYFRAPPLPTLPWRTLLTTRTRCPLPETQIFPGDNFYPSGLNGTDDPLFAQTFSDVYTASSLQVSPPRGGMGVGGACMTVQQHH